MITNIKDDSKLLIKPNNNGKLGVKKYVYIIESRDRDISKYPSPSHYKIDLEREFSNISEIELLCSYMPDSIYTLNNNNNILDLYIDGVNFSIKCPIGIYSCGDTLAESLEYIINNFLQSNNYSCKIVVDFNSRLNKVLFKFIYKNDNFYNICFNFVKTTYNRLIDYPPKSVGYVLGFLPRDYPLEYGTIILSKHLEIKDDIYMITCEQDKNLHSKIWIPDNENIQTTIKFLYLKAIGSRDNKIYKLEYKNLGTDSSSIYATYNGNILIGRYKLFFDYILPPNIINLNPHKYALLNLPKCNRYSNGDKLFSSSFVHLPLTNNHPYPSTNIVNISKKFNNNYGILKDLEVKIYEYGKNLSDNREKILFDFSGQDHTLVFCFVESQQVSQF